MSNILSLNAFDQALAKKGWTLKKLADEYDKKYPNINGKTIYNTLRKWRSKDGNPELKCLVRICDLLDCDVDFILGRIQEHTHVVSQIKSEIGLSENAIIELQKHSKDNSSPRELFTLSVILSEHFELLSDITDYFLFPDNIQTKFHMDTVTGTLEPRESFVFDSEELVIEQANQNIPIDSKVLRNAMLNIITEKLILLKKSYSVKRDQKLKRTILKAPNTN